MVSEYEVSTSGTINPVYNRIPYNAAPGYNIPTAETRFSAGTAATLTYEKPTSVSYAMPPHDYAVIEDGRGDAYEMQTLVREKNAQVSSFYIRSFDIDHLTSYSTWQWLPCD